MGVLHLRYGLVTFDMNLLSQIVSIYTSVISVIATCLCSYDMMMMVVEVVVVVLKLKTSKSHCWLVTFPWRWSIHGVGLIHGASSLALSSRQTSAKSNTHIRCTQ